MKKDKDFFSNLITVAFIAVYVTVTIIACRKVELNGLVAVASVMISPVLFLLSILYRERYGHNKTIKLLLYSMFAVVLSAIVIGVAGIFPVFAYDGLDIIFKINYRITLASIIGFYISQILCFSIYDYLSYQKPIKFLFAAVIATTINSLIFVVIAFLGTAPIKELAELFTGQYVYSVIAIMVYSFIFEYVINTIEQLKNRDTEMEILKDTKEKKPVKRVTKKKASTKEITKPKKVTKK